MNQNIKPSDRIAVLDAIDPDATAAGDVSTDWVSLATVGNVLAVIQTGELGTSATVDAKIEQAQDSSGTGAKDITGAAITQLTQAGSDSDKQALINVRPENLDIDNDFNHVRLTITVAVATSDVGGLLLGLDGKYQPVTQASTVAESVSV